MITISFVWWHALIALAVLAWLGVSAWVGVRSGWWMALMWPLVVLVGGFVQ